VIEVSHHLQPGWTIEAVIANGPFLWQPDATSDQTLWLVVIPSSSSNAIYWGGEPLGTRIAVWFSHAQKQDWHPTQNFAYKIAPSLAFVHPMQQLTKTLSALPPPDAKAQSYMELQAERQQLLDILCDKPFQELKPKPRHSKSGPLVQKKMPRKKSQANPPSLDLLMQSEILERRLGACPGVERAHDADIEMTNILARVLQQQAETLQIIPGHSLSHVTVPRRSNLPTTLRILVMSDTHGYEDQFDKFFDTNDQDRDGIPRLPDADILIHCGDFGPSTAKLQALLEAQSHIAVKLVVRGNHDPRKVDLGPSIRYSNKRESLVLEDGTVMEVRPFDRSHNQPPLSSMTDILVTHEPPFGLCDQTCRGQHVGSWSLLQATVMEKPAVWFCGHIHEGRSAVWQDKMLVINAANANPGKANKLTNGPVVVELVPKRNDYT
jgi:Icc-related predicted phosphoesterase